MRKFLAASLLGMLAAIPSAGGGAPLRLRAVVPMPGVRGRIDHMAVDLRGRRLFLSALGNDTLEVIDLRTNRLLHTLRGLREPQGVTYVPDSNRIFVANGGDGRVRIFDGATYRLVGTVDCGSDADDTRYDPATHRVYVGYGEGGIAVLDSATGQRLGEISLPVHPEAFEVEAGGGKIFVNLPEAREIAVLDGRRETTVGRWPMLKYRANFPMALDAPDHRLFVVTRRPPQFLALDAAHGGVVAHLNAVGDADDIWYDAVRRRIYISGGEGYVSVLAQHDRDHYTPLAEVPTLPGARTSLFSPQLDRLYVAVPRRGARPAELRIYAPAP